MQVRWGRREEEVAKDILSLGFLSWFDIVLSDEYIQKKLLGFFPKRGFPRINHCVSILWCAWLSFSNPNVMVMMK